MELKQDLVKTILKNYCTYSICEVNSWQEPVEHFIDGQFTLWVNLCDSNGHMGTIVTYRRLTATVDCANHHHTVKLPHLLLTLPPHQHTHSNEV